MRDGTTLGKEAKAFIDKGEILKTIMLCNCIKYTPPFMKSGY